MQDNNYDGSLEDFKIAVSSGRGSTVHCIEPDTTTNTVTGYGTPPYSLSLESNANWTGCDPTGMFGPKNLSMQEVVEWSSQQSIPEIEQVEGTRGSDIDTTISYGDVSNVIGRELMNTNPDFEDCINKILPRSR